jgi:type IV pilus assembly protein PilO
MKPLKPEDKNFILWAVLITIVVAGASGYFAFMGFQSWMKKQVELAEIRDSLQDARQKEKQLPVLQKRIEETEQEIAEVEKRLPNDKRAPELFKELNDLAVIANQEYLSMQALPVKDEKLYFEIPLGINLRADYHNLGRYLNMIERSKRFAKIDNIVIEYDFDNPLNQQVQLTVSTFMFKKSPETGTKRASGSSRS